MDDLDGQSEPARPRWRAGGLWQAIWLSALALECLPFGLTLLYAANGVFADIVAVISVAAAGLLVLAMLASFALAKLGVGNRGPSKFSLGTRIFIVVAVALSSLVLLGLPLLAMLTYFALTKLAGAQHRNSKISLRTLLIIVAACAVGCASLGRRIEYRRREAQAVAEIVNTGGQTWRTDQMFPHHKPEIVAAGQFVFGENFFTEMHEVACLNATDAQLSQLRELASVETLTVSGKGFTADGLKSLQGLRVLENLNLSDSGITDTGLASLQGLENLKDLRLINTRIDDAGIGNLRDLPALLFLNLGQTDVTDAGLGNLRDLSALLSLRLNRTDVTDAGIQKLNLLKSLKYLDVTETKVTPAGISRFIEAMPNCQVVQGNDRWNLQPAARRYR